MASQFEKLFLKTPRTPSVFHVEASFVNTRRHQREHLLPSASMQKSARRIMGNRIANMHLLPVVFEFTSAVEAGDVRTLFVN